MNLLLDHPALATLYAALAVGFWMAWSPFMGLPSHQDAGWHAYWAAFRRRGVGLERQHNILMGCSRIGSKMLYFVWFALLGLGDPDGVARRIYRPLIITASLGLAWGVTAFAGAEVGLASGIALLVLMATPTLAVHYDCAERSALVLNVGFFAATLALMTVADAPLWAWGLLVWAMFVSAFLFKITQLGEYFALWAVAFGTAPSVQAFVASFIGGVAAVAAIAAFLAAAGLLKSENLGILAYFSNTRQSRSNGAPADSLVDAIEAKVEDGFGKQAAKTLVSVFGESIARALLQRARNAAAFLPFIVKSTRGATLLVVTGVIVGEGVVHTAATAWLAGALFVLVLQGRFFPFHFMPLIVPAAVLVAFGATALVAGMAAGGGLFMVLAVIVLAAVTLDLRFLLVSNADIALDLRYWPERFRYVFELNRLARPIADYLKAHTTDNDEVLVIGALPQAYVLADRKCTVNWLNTNANLMGQVLPAWLDILKAKMKEKPPAYIVQVDATPDIGALSREVGLTYERETDIAPGAAVYRLSA